MKQARSVAVAAVVALLYLPLCQVAVVSHDGLIYARRAELLELGFFDGKVLYILLGHLALELTALFTDDRSAVLWTLSALSALAMAGAAQALFVALRAREIPVATALFVTVAFAAAPLVVLLGVHPAHYALPAFVLCLALALHARGRLGWAVLALSVGIGAHIYLAPAALVFGVAALRTLPRRRALIALAGGAVFVLVWLFGLGLQEAAAFYVRIFFDDYFLFTAAAFAPIPPHELLAYGVSNLLSLVLACPFVLAALAGAQRARPSEPVAPTLAALYLLLVLFVPSEQLSISTLENHSMIGSAYVPLILMKMQIFALPPLLLALAPAIDCAQKKLGRRALVGSGAVFLVASIVVLRGAFAHATLPLDERSLAALREVEDDAVVYARWSYPELDFFARQDVRPLYGSTYLGTDAELARVLAELDAETQAHPVYVVDALLDPDDLSPIEQRARARHARLIEAVRIRHCARPHVDGLHRLEPTGCAGRLVR